MQGKGSLEILQPRPVGSGPGVYRREKLWSGVLTIIATCGAEIANILFFVFLVVYVASFIVGLMRRK